MMAWVIEEEFGVAQLHEPSFFWMVGGYYSKEDLTFRKDILGLDFVVRTSIITLFEQDAESYAGFAHTEYDLNDQWKLTLGARYTQDDRSYSGGSFTEDPYGVDLAGVFFSAPQQSSGGFDEDYVDGKIALDWTPQEDVLYYASISLGHKGGGYDGSTITDPSSFTPFEAEEVLAYEIGIKSTLFDSTLQLNASAFFYDYQDMQAEGRVRKGNRVRRDRWQGRRLHLDAWILPARAGRRDRAATEGLGRRRAD